MATDHSQGILPFTRQITFGLSMDHQCAFRDSLGLAFHFDQPHLDPVYSHRYAGRFSYLSFPGQLGLYDYSFEPTFIRKRNERERQRVRCVNEGYARLREHLPQEFEDKRLSKVETLRAAINYIKHLQSLLDLSLPGNITELSSDAEQSPRPKQLPECNSDGESKHSLSDSGDANY
ncbi:achaete-scute homolog 4-like [Chanos chanos]|uniref:Achaete-scute homolog 4-like n=1 Tax=Chanos chanos TaxID=29144 RepID=A0A6J2US14_CHACN|nr:achaete-scute homolog 4-like [Chanos chanos]